MFSQVMVYTLIAQEWNIRQALGVNLGVVIPIREAVSVIPLQKNKGANSHFP